MSERLSVGSAANAAVSREQRSLRAAGRRIAESTTPTTWRTTPACATDAMIEAGARALLAPIRDPETFAREAAARVWAAMWDKSPKPPTVSAWLPIGPDAKTGADVLLGRYADAVRIVACWDERCYGGNPGWQTLEGVGHHEDAFDVYRPLDPIPPATGDANG